MKSHLRVKSLCQHSVPFEDRLCLLGRWALCNISAGRFLNEAKAGKFLNAKDSRELSAQPIHLDLKLSILLLQMYSHKFESAPAT